MIQHYSNAMPQVSNKCCFLNPALHCLCLSLDMWAWKAQRGAGPLLLASGLRTPCLQCSVSALKRILLLLLLKGKTLTYFLTHEGGRFHTLIICFHFFPCVHFFTFKMFFIYTDKFIWVPKYNQEFLYHFSFLLCISLLPSPPIILLVPPSPPLPCTPCY